MRVKSKSAVLHMLLGSPNYISGQELANRLGVSRQTVGKCVQQLREEGYKIEATQRLGYKFLGDNNLVTAEVLTPRLHCPLEPIYYATVDSTNTEAKRLLKFFDYFLAVSSEDIPRNSLLREFIGGNSFYRQKAK